MNSQQLKTIREGLDKLHAKMEEYNGLCASFDMSNGFQENHNAMLARCLGEAVSCLLDVLTPLHKIQTNIASCQRQLKCEAGNAAGDMQTPGVGPAKHARVGDMTEMRGLLGRMNALAPSLGMRQEIADFWRQAGGAMID